ncbi:hypothetical protein Pmani_026901 [Petrolisthes manimaculis]|uniref:Uncharacterized protein n=1 Tax=Petrolisthes manimaculis TaxID=1843537 RepID=A0AAE1P4A7_9EUCA|nr:hypothetical protein Pmani_026901 [Petrolisthes manimaculis]
MRRDEAGVLRSILFGVASSPVLYSSSSSSSSSSGRHSSHIPGVHGPTTESTGTPISRVVVVVQDSSPGTTYYTVHIRAQHLTELTRAGSHRTPQTLKGLITQTLGDTTRHRTQQHRISQDSSDPQRTHYPNSRIIQHTEIINIDLTRFFRPPKDSSLLKL